MKKQRKTHSREFKQEAVALVTDQGYSCAEAGRSLGASGALIGRWKQQLEDDRSGAFPGKGKRTAEQQRANIIRRNPAHLAIGEQRVGQLVLVSWEKTDPGTYASPALDEISG